MKPKGFLIAYCNGNKCFDEDLYPVESYKYCIDYCIDYNKNYVDGDDYVKLFMCIGKSGLVLLYDKDGSKKIFKRKIIC
ncbi:hypothetical protein QTH47_13085 [Clostridium perfringens]|nr:hypothetical protein [Clostridium perfringens]